jgi:hypothetical protein
MKSTIYKKSLAKVYYKTKVFMQRKKKIGKVVQSKNDEQLKLELFKDLVPVRRLKDKSKLFVNTNFH